MRADDIEKEKEEIPVVACYDYRIIKAEGYPDRNIIMDNIFFFCVSKTLSSC